MSGTGTADPSSPPAASEPSKDDARSTLRPSGRRWVVTLGAVAAILVAAVVLAYVVTGGFHLGNTSSSSKGYVLVPNGTSYSMVVGQFNGIDFVVTSASTITGQIDSSRGIQVYIFTPDEFEYLTKNLTVGAYVWTSGVVANDTVYNVAISVTAGSWVLSFVNPNEYVPTGVTFYTDLVLASG